MSSRSSRGRRSASSGFHRSEQVHDFNDFEDFRRRAAFYTETDSGYGSGLGSLADEIIETDLDVQKGSRQPLPSGMEFATRFAACRITAA
ncbi:hypothetical protein ACIA5C_44145 [Actinoplanes sp. NPDC051343]|uniref:hypothetical protein n=1 Tax=Actinoplanes sp. NPDC051343 TaxID=3363906 RepID=UPI00378B4FF8